MHRRIRHHAVLGDSVEDREVENPSKLLERRWRERFGAKSDELLCDLSSTCFEINGKRETEELRQFCYSRDKRGHCRARGRPGDPDHGETLAVARRHGVRRAARGQGGLRFGVRADAQPSY